ncbi:MAG: cupin domain-containing protein [Sphingobacterium sp.]
MENYPELLFEKFQKDLKSDNEVLLYPLSKDMETTKAHSHDFYILLLFESGSGVHTIDSKDFVVKSKQLHFIQPQQVHRYRFNKGTAGYRLMISRKFFETFIAGLQYALALYMKHPVFDLNDKDFENLWQEFNAVVEEIKAKRMFRQLIIARFYVITYSISNIAAPYFDDLTVYNGNPILLEYIALIDKYYINERSVSFYAEQLKITPNYLNILCKRDFIVRLQI